MRLANKIHRFLADCLLPCLLRGIHLCHHVFYLSLQLCRAAVRATMLALGFALFQDVGYEFLLGDDASVLLGVRVE